MRLIFYAAVHYVTGTESVPKGRFIYKIHYHLQVEPNQIKLYNKTDAIFSIYGKNWINPWNFFLNSHLGLSRSLRSNENRGQIFEAATSKFCNHSWHFFSSPQNGKVDLCMTNGSKVLIYLTLLHFLLHYLQEYSKIWNIAKSNKSELWNHLSYRGLPYFFKRLPAEFQKWLQNSRS